MEAAYLLGQTQFFAAAIYKRITNKKMRSTSRIGETP